ncbi:MAG: kelch repeat-containing protein, partial [Flavobacteriales bacterium]|nr:kelch repeat-containing protein [Flavobacteriales bacterium]
MRSVCLAALLLVETLAMGQGFNERYDAFGLGYQQSATDIVILEQGYTVFSVSSDYDSLSPGEWFFHASALLTHVDIAGNKIWEKRAWRALHNTVTGWANCCDTIPGGGYIVGGASEDTTGYDEVYLMRFNAAGDTLWTRVFSGPTEDHYMIGRQVKRTPDGGFLIVGD